ncbi:hypothetical protein Tco_1482367 [Tanacetum coccineum]
MVVLESCPKHNMVAYLEKTNRNAEFHEIIDFLTRSFIHNALTVSPVVSTTFVKQFWMSAKSKIINNVRYFTTKVAGNPVSISEASIRSDLLFYDANGIDSLPNQAIFDAIQLMGYEGDLTVTDQAKEIKHLKAQIKKLKKKAKPVITHHRAWMKSGGNMQSEPSVHKDPLFDELDDDEIDNMETEDAQGMGRTKYVVHEEKERKEKEVSTEDALGTDRSRVSTDKEEVSTIRQMKVLTESTEGRSATPTTPTTTTPTIFGDDETIAQVLLNMSQAKAVSREKEKGVELKDVEETERPRPTLTRSLLTLKPLPKIDPKDKGKKKFEEEDESDTKSEGIPEAEKKFKQLAHDEEIIRKMQEDWETKEERKRLAEEEATNAALIQDFDDIKARMEADRLLALRLQEEERESSSLWKREQNSFMIQLQLKEGFLQNKELLQ